MHFTIFMKVCKATGKNDLMWCITYRETVSGLVICSKFDAWHCEILWTYLLTRLLWFTCDYVHLILYITLHSINLKPNCEIHFFVYFQVSFQDSFERTPRILWSIPLSTFWSTLPGMFSRMLAIELNGTLPTSLTVYSHISSQDPLKHTL